jgi:uracil-DNA glycosylase family 4
MRQALRPFGRNAEDVQLDRRAGKVRRMQSEIDTRGMAALLDWYREMGVDTSVAADPTNWLERGEAAPGTNFRLPVAQADAGALPAQPAARSDALSQPGVRQGAPSQAPARDVREPQPSAPQSRAPMRAAPTTELRSAPKIEPAPPRPAFAATPPDAAGLAARTVAGEARSLDELEAALRAFDGCGLKATAKSLCFYRGAPQARLMIVGEAPGREEDLEGRPFVGRAGQLLDKMLAAINLKEQDVHITNVVYWRPPGNRTPTPQESQVCRPFLERQMELVGADVMLLLGGAAAKQIFATDDGIMRVRGKWREIPSGGRTIKTMATLHPAYLLRTPAAKRHAWRDLLAIQAALGGPSK